MKVTFAEVPLGDGTVGFSLAPGGWTFTVSRNEAGPNAPPAQILSGTNPFDLRRLLARFGAAIEVAGLGDLEPNGED